MLHEFLTLNRMELIRSCREKVAKRASRLGLSISRKSVEANHGVLSVRNKDASGCIFTVDLPRYLMPAA